MRVEYDAAALRIADRIRSSLDLADVLQYTVDELGKATGVSRSLIQLAPGADGTSKIVEWDRGDTLPLGVRPPTLVARRVFETRQPVVANRLEDTDEEIRRYLSSVGSVSAVAIPIRWQREVMAALGFQDTVPKDWREHVLPLLERLEGQIGAALAQAAVFEQQQLALQQMRDLDRMREELLANVSHELRTPLTAIVGTIKTIRRADVRLDDPARAKLFAALEEQSDRLAALTEDILQLSRYTRGKQRLARAPIRLSQVVEEARAALPVEEGREVVVAVEADEPVEADRNRMIQVFANLLQNAVRHGDGRITIRVFRDGDSAVVWVGDEGPGVPPAYEQEMFDPFTHAGGRSDSTGLGLSIARAIVEAHGGSVTYLPANGIRSHQFVVALPTREPAAEAA